MFNHEAVRSRKSSVLFEQLEPRRFLSAGSLDATFGDGGIVLVNDPQYAPTSVTASAQEADGKVLLVGKATANGGTDGAVVLLDNDGTTDLVFGGGVPVALNDPAYDNFAPTGVASTPNGDMVVVGTVTGRHARIYAAVVRINSDGSIDSTLGNDGWAAMPFGTSAAVTSVLVDQDGRIILGGSTVAQGDRGVESFAFARLNSDGSIDNTFGRHGYAVVNFTHSRSAATYPAAVNAMAFGANGTIVAVGGSTFYEGGYMEAARLSADGAPDTSFGTDGRIVVAKAAGELNALTVAGDGEIYATGGDADLSYYPAASEPFLVVAITAHGKFDTGFGQGGIASFSAAPSKARQVKAASGGIMLDSDGKIILSGTAVRGFDNYAFFTASLNTSGDLNTSFGNQGISLVPEATETGLGNQGNSNSQPATFGVFEADNGDFIVPYSDLAATDGDALTFAETVPALRVAAFAPSGSIDSNAGVSSIFSINGPQAAGDNLVSSAVALPDGSILAGGDFNDDTVFVKRYSTDGQLLSTEEPIFPDSGEPYGDATNFFPTGSGGYVAFVGASQGPRALEAFGARNTVDASFGSDGIVALPGGGEGGISEAAQLSDGSIATLVGYGDSRPSINTTLTTYSPSGELMASISEGEGEGFMGDGVFAGVTAGPGNRVLVAFAVSPHDPQIRRYNEGLTPDISYGDNGISDLSSLGIDYADPIVVGPSGDVYFVGSQSGESAEVLGHLLSDGSPDASFGSNGTIPFPSGGAFALVELDSKLLLVSSSGSVLQISRLNLDGTPDTAFGDNGEVNVDLGEKADLLQANLQTVDGQPELLASGRFDLGTSVPSTGGYSGGTEGFIARVVL